MQKPQSLRAALAAALPDIVGRHPEMLQMWIDKGKVRCINGAGGSFAWEYNLSVYFTEFHGHPAMPAVIITDWLARNQPDLLQQGTGITFEAEIIDEKTWDVLFDLPLTEDAIVTRGEDGGWTIDHPGEPDPFFADSLPLGNPASTLQQGWAEHDPNPEERLV